LKCHDWRDLGHQIFERYKMTAKKLLGAKLGSVIIEMKTKWTHVKNLTNIQDGDVEILVDFLKSADEEWSMVPGYHLKTAILSLSSWFEV
jgi:hypothetical protein